MTKKRAATVSRKTKETDITVKICIDGSGKAKIDTGIGILDHMLELFAFHGLFDLGIRAKGDLKVDIHHTNEDVGIVLGDAFKKALGYKKGIVRSGSASWPMEDVVATVVADISGRGFFKGITFEPVVQGARKDEEGYSCAYANHFFESFAKRMGLDLSIKLASTNPDLHTNLEPIFKALGKALDQATQIDPRRKGVPSTKGVID
ncbi:MAG: imidazoleglycerol-phosphate dehydratase [Candidatus Omnitrophica bacterium]|jgi:imidazoleglycerol-phosphate dehydratase|nr:imidazoleglycerol-phosphate dehydratase [Candidatus Omnitrophota bacterium]MDD5654137.1 imidazoleglycerol-phosphate dehydratase [Candidatus Omnitrophota bacterium]